MLASTSVCFALEKIDIGIDKIEFLTKSVKTRLIMMRSQTNFFVSFHIGEGRESQSHPGLETKGTETLSLVSVSY